MHSYNTQVNYQTQLDVKDIHPFSHPKNPIKIAPKPPLHCNSAATTSKQLPVDLLFQIQTEKATGILCNFNKLLS